MAATMPDDITFGQKYDPAMHIEDEAEARAYFELCVEHTMRVRPCEREEAERIEHYNLGYWAGYYGTRTQERVERLFQAPHPIFGPVLHSRVETPEDTLRLGIKTDEAMRRKAGDHAES